MPDALTPFNPIVQRLLPPHRKSARIALAEGATLAAEALAGCWECESLLLSEETQVTPAGRALMVAAHGRRCVVHTLSAKAWAKISDMSTPPGVGVIVRSGAINLPDANAPARLLILDRLADPGNAGTLLRSARAFGFSTLLIEGGVTPENEKFIRATAGMCFHEGATYLAKPGEETTAQLHRQGFQLLVLDPRAKERLDGPSLPASQRVALVLGNETHGVDATRWPDAAQRRIPMAMGVESLNVAMTGAVAMYELSRGMLP